MRIICEFNRLNNYKICGNLFKIQLIYMENQHYQAIIIGGGPAGLTAGIYLSRAKVKTLILDSSIAGGQMILTHKIANYPGVENISGYQLSMNMLNQAKSFGCDVMSGISIQKIDFESTIKRLELSNGKQFSSDVIILATGGRSRTLGIEGEELFKGKGISYCATCDGDFFQDKEIAVVGGGNTALEEAVSLTKFAKKVTIFHQFDHFQGSKYAEEEARNHPKIEIHLNTKLTRFYGEDSLESVDYIDVTSNEIHHQLFDGVFVFIGYEANTEFLQGRCIELNKFKEIVVDSNLQTNVKGVFAAGDATTKKYRQITTAVADGTVAALNAIEFLKAL